MKKKVKKPPDIIWMVIACVVIWITILLFGCKTTTYDADARTKQDPVDPRVQVQYDKNGNVEGTWKQSPIDPRVYIYRKKR